MEMLESDGAKWTEARIGNILRNLKVDVTKPPKCRGIPLKLYNRVKGAEKLSLFDMPDSLAEQV